VSESISLPPCLCGHHQVVSRQPSVCRLTEQGSAEFRFLKLCGFSLVRRRLRQIRVRSSLAASGGARHEDAVDRKMLHPQRELHESGSTRGAAILAVVIFTGWKPVPLHVHGPRVIAKARPFPIYVLTTEAQRRREELTQ
jgi:hypothetical protein